MKKRPIETTLITALFTFTAATALIAFSSISTAQEIAPKAISVTGAETPGLENETFHRVSFTVKADGTTERPRIISNHTSRFIIPGLMETVREWTFTPGTVDGAPVDFFNQEFMFVSRLSPELAISTIAQEALSGVSSLMTEGKNKAALKRVKKTLSKSVVTLFDYAFTQDMKAQIHMALGEQFAALESTKISTRSHVTSTGETKFFLSPETLEPALRRRFLLAANLSQNPEAVRAYDILLDSFDVPANDPIHQQAAAIQTVLDSPEPLGMLAKVIDDSWIYQPARRIFSVSSVDGNILKINVRCDHKELLTLDFEEGVDWTLPDSFGKCELEFLGRQGTEFTLYEFSE